MSTPTSRVKPPATFPATGDRVQHEQYGVGTVTMLDVYHTVIDFDAHGLRRFVTNRIVVERTDDPGPTAAERRKTVLLRAKEERARVKAAALVEKPPPRRRRNKAERDADAAETAADKAAETAAATPSETLV